MDAFQIILLVLGVAIFVVSFFLPARKKEESTGSLRNEERRIKETMDEELKKNLAQMSLKADEIMEEKRADALERTERGLERVSNEKMMAVNEYADTVLTDINKNHEEVVFLYSMLNDKQEELKGNMAELEKGNKEAKKRVKELGDKIKESEDARLLLEETIAKKEEEKSAGEEMIPDAQEELKQETLSKDVEELMEAFTKQESSKRRAALEEDLKKEKEEKEQEQAAPEKKKTRKRSPKIPEMSALSGENSNEMILKLYQEGKSNVAIAKELGLGVGEVKLVIDLFKQS